MGFRDNDRYSLRTTKPKKKFNNRSSGNSNGILDGFEEDNTRVTTMLRKIPINEFAGRGWKSVLPVKPVYHSGNDIVRAIGAGVIRYERIDGDTDQLFYAISPLDPFKKNPIDTSNTREIIAGSRDLIKPNFLIYRFPVEDIKKEMDSEKQSSFNEKGELLTKSKTTKNTKVTFINSNGKTIDENWELVRSRTKQENEGLDSNFIEDIQEAKNFLIKQFPEVSFVLIEPEETFE